MPKSIIIRLPGITANGQRPLIQSAPLPPLWTPQQLTGLRGHWVPNTLAGVDGTEIENLAASSGLSNTIYQTTAGRKPVIAALGGRKAAYFDGVDDGFRSPDVGALNAADKITMFFRLKMDGFDTDNGLKPIMVFYGGTTAITRLYFGLENVSGASKRLGFAYRNNDADTSKFAWSSTVADLNEHVIIASFDRSVSPTRFEIWMDGVNIMGTNTIYNAGAWDAVDGATPYIGASNATGFKGRLSNFGYIRNILNTANRQYLEGYLAHSGNLLTLPNAHPYFTQPPRLSA
ncbi:MAG: hypothetical protein ABW007_19255 [Chitinophagaceae bacterium]